VAEVGVGGGQYAELLAGQGCCVHLADVSPKLLDATQERLRRAGWQDRLLGVSRASATDLGGLPTGAFDAVLLLGPLYHLLQPEERHQAVQEATRLLKPHGWLFAAGINRLTYWRDLFRGSPQEVVPRRAFHEGYLRDGNLDPTHAPPIGYAHLTTVAGFRELFIVGFEEVALLGVEAFTGPWQQILAGLPADAAEAWLDLIERAAATPEGLGTADHFLYVGTKRPAG
jgi:SAM-dependent methyltransferase